MISKKHSVKGITIIELQAVMVITAIVITIVISMWGLVHRYQIESLSNRAYSHIALARSEAMKRNHMVSICPSSNGETCNSINWSDGWLVFTNINNNFVVDAEDIIIQIRQETDPNLSINSGGVNQINFLMNGNLSTSTELIICRQQEINGLINKINITSSGQIIRSSEFGNCN